MPQISCPADLEIHENKWMKFTELETPERKTRVVACINRKSGISIARLAWYGPWRQYCLFPEPRTVFNEGCLESITAALTTLMDARTRRSQTKREEQGRQTP